MTKQERQAWTIAISLFIALFFMWGGGFNTGPIFLNSFIRSFHWGHEKASWITSLLALSVGFSSPFAGWLLDRFEARYVMGGGTALVVIGLVSASRSHTFEGLLISNLILGIGLGASTWLPSGVIIANWFAERRGAALGLATAGMEFGGMFMTFLAGYVISRSNFRDAYLVIAVPALFLILPLLLIVVRTRPASAAQAGTARRLSVAESAKALPGYEVGEALRTRALWMLIAAQLCYGVSVGGFFFHLVAYLTGIGYGLKSATGAISIILGLAAAGKAIMGAIGDRIGGRTALGLGFLILASSYIIALVSTQVWVLVIFMLAIGISGAAPVALVPMLLAETLGLKRFGTLFGWLTLLTPVGISCGEVLVGKLFDATGSYTFAYEICALIAVMAGIASFLCVAPAPRVAVAAVAPQAHPKAV
jgi:MFS family permease